MNENIALSAPWFYPLFLPRRGQANAIFTGESLVALARADLSFSFPKSPQVNGSRSDHRAILLFSPSRERRHSG